MQMISTHTLGHASTQEGECILLKIAAVINPARQQGTGWLLFGFFCSSARFELFCGRGAQTFLPSKNPLHPSFFLRLSIKPCFKEMRVAKG